MGWITPVPHFWRHPQMGLSTKYQGPPTRGFRFFAMWDGSVKWTHPFPVPAKGIGGGFKLATIAARILKGLPFGHQHGIQSRTALQ